MTEPTRPLSARAVLREGFGILVRFVRARPRAFAIAVGGATLFAAAIIASSVVVGWVAGLLNPVRRLDGWYVDHVTGCVGARAAA